MNEKSPYSRKDAEPVDWAQAMATSPSLEARKSTPPSWPELEMQPQDPSSMPQNLNVAAPAAAPVPAGETRLQLALDYGTTFTGKLPSHEPLLHDGPGC